MDAQLNTAHDQVKANRHNPRFVYSGMFGIAGGVKAVDFRVQPTGNVMAVTGTTTAVGSDVFKAFETLERYIANRTVAA